MSEGSGNANPRKKAAAARAEQLAKEERRDRILRLTIGSVVVLVVFGIVGGAWAVSKGQQSANEPPKPDANAALPNGVDPATYGYVVNSAVPNTGVPQVQVWEDFQCPACKSFEDSGSADALDAAAEAGEIDLQIRPTTFLDNNLPQSKNSSALATNAWGCAINAGKPLEYQNGVYDIQPANEGTGFTEQQLLDLGKTVGITGDAYTTFESCVKSKQFAGWVANSQEQFVSGEVKGTPAIYVNGKELENKVGLYGDPVQLLAAINAAAK